MPKSLDSRLLLEVNATLLPVSLFTALIDWRLFGWEGFAPSSVIMAAAFILSTVILSRSRVRCVSILPGSPYWSITAATSVYLCAFYTLGFIGAVYSGLRIVSGPQYLAIAGCIKTMVSRCGLRPQKTWVLVAVGFVPLLLQPFMLLVPTSWEAMHSIEFLCRFAFEVFACIIFLLQTLLGSYRVTEAGRVARAAQRNIISDASLSLALLETSMPSSLARSLLEGVSPESLNRAFAASSIAFIALDDFHAVCSKDPSEFFAQLDRIYTAFDGLIDVFGHDVNKVCCLLL